MADSLTKAFSSVLKLQPKWSKSLTPEMKERRQLIRDTIPKLLEDIVAPADFKVEGEAGGGYRARVPWVRIYDPLFSPKPTEGWYAVFLFAADGSAVFSSLNQGTTDFVKGGAQEKNSALISSRVQGARTTLQEVAADASGLLSHIELKDTGGPGEGIRTGKCVYSRPEYVAY